MTTSLHLRLSANLVFSPQGTTVEVALHLHDSDGIAAQLWHSMGEGVKLWLRVLTEGVHHPIIVAVSIPQQNSQLDCQIDRDLIPQHTRTHTHTHIWIVFPPPTPKSVDFPSESGWEK